MKVNGTVVMFFHLLKELQQHRYFFVFIVFLLMMMCAVNVIDSFLSHVVLLPNKALWQDGQIWRLVSGHFVHASWEHLLLNIINLVLLRVVFSQWVNMKIFLMLIICSSIAICTGLIIFSDLSYYVGFSGIFYSLLMYFLCAYWHKQRLIFSIAIFCVIGKIIHEQILGASQELVDFIHIQVAIDAHAWGLLCGGVFFFLERSLFKNHHNDTDIR